MTWTRIMDCIYMRKVPRSDRFRLRCRVTGIEWRAVWNGSSYDLLRVPTGESEGCFESEAAVKEYLEEAATAALRKEWLS